MNRLLGYLVTLGMLFVVFDLMLRLLGTMVPAIAPLLIPQPVRVEFQETRGWANKTSQTVASKGREFDVDVSFNSLGMRGPEVGKKAADTTRILMVGDSFTMGWSVEEQDLFLRVLERALGGNGHKVEILNGGTEGYATDQELVWLEEVGSKLDPDYVVLLPYVNDIYWNSVDKYAHRAKCKFEATADGVNRVTSSIEQGDEPSWFKRNTSIGNMAHVFSIVGEQAPHKQGGSPLESMALLSSPPKKIQDSWKITNSLVGEFANRVRAMGAKPVAMLVPNKWEIDEEAPIQSLQLANYSKSDLAPSKPTDRFKATCEAAGYDVIDPRAALKARNANGPVYFTHDWHWNEDGNAVVAAEFLNYFQGADQLGAGTGKVQSTDVLAGLQAPETGGGVPKWAWVLGILWLVLGFSYIRSYPNEKPAIVAFLKVGALIGFVAGVFLGVGALAGSLPPTAGRLLMPLIIVGLLLFIAFKVGKRFSVIGELYNTFLRRGHWYMLPMLVVMLSIGMLLVVAASSPFVAPFIYTLF